MPAFTASYNTLSPAIWLRISLSKCWLVKIQNLPALKSWLCLFLSSCSENQNFYLPADCLPQVVSDKTWKSEVEVQPEPKWMCSFGDILMQLDHAKPQLIAPSCWKTVYVYMYSFNLLPNSLFLHQQTGRCFSSPSLKHPKLGRGTLQMVLQTTHLSHSTNRAVRSQWYPLSRSRLSIWHM